MLKRIKQLVFELKMVKWVYLFIKRVKRIVSCHLLVVFGLNGLTRLTKQVMFRLTYNGLGSHASKLEPNSPTSELCMNHINSIIDF
jgi:hypothetical protein